MKLSLIRAQSHENPYLEFIPREPEKARHRNESSELRSVSDRIVLRTCAS